MSCISKEHKTDFSRGQTSLKLLELKGGILYVLSYKLVDTNYTRQTLF